MGSRKKVALILTSEPQDGGEHQYALLAAGCLLEKSGGDIELMAFCGNSFWRGWCRKMGVRDGGYPLLTVSVKEMELNYRMPHLAGLYYTYITSFGKKIRKEKIDILFSTREGIFITNYKVKLIVPVHDLMHRYEPDFPEVCQAFDKREIYMKCLSKYADCLLVDSKLGKRQFEESYIKRPGRKLRIISLPYIVPDYIWKTEEKYIDVPDKYIFYPAQFWKHKNHLNLIKAIKLLRESVPDIFLVLAGSEKNYCEEIKAYIAENKLEPCVKILGFVSDENMIYLYKHAVGMVMPSYFGPTNIPPLEAMALGCPVAVSDKYAMPEQVGKAGLLFNPDSPEEIAECIKKMWLDEELREKMKELGYKRIQRWTRREFCEKLYKIIKSV